MRGSFVDIENELADIEKEVAMLAGAIDVYKRTDSTADMSWHWLAIQGLASGIEKIYTGCERVMAMIANSVDQAPVDHVEGWHVSLLKRMANPFPDARAAIISGECYQALDRLRAFRHRERNSYGLALDSEIVAERANQTLWTFSLFKTEVQSFGRNRSA